MIKKIISFTSLSLVFSLTACVAPYVNPPQSGLTSLPGQIGGVEGGVAGAIVGLPAESIAIGSAAGIVVGASAGAYLVSTPRILNILRDEGVQVVQVGQTLRIIIPSDKIFRIGATTIETHGYKILDDVAMFLMRYGNVPLTIYAFSDRVYDDDTAFKITARQARRVSGYLWAKGRPFYHLRPEGMGNRYQVASSKNPIGSAYNRRIEIIAPVLPGALHYMKGIKKALDLES